jgi:peptide chain release factor subunit 3
LPAGAEETDVQTGFVLCSISNPVPMVSTFECQLVILELLEHNPIFTVGYRCEVDRGFDLELSLGCEVGW